MIFPLLLALVAQYLQDRRESDAPIAGIPEVVLAALPPIELSNADGPAPEIREVRDFCVLGTDRLAILRADQTLLVTDEHGTILRSLHFSPIVLPLGPSSVFVGDFDRIEWMRGGSVVLAQRYRLHRGFNHAAALRIDLDAGKLELAALLPKSEYQLELAASPTGELAFLAQPDSSRTAVYVVDEHGELVWSRTKGVCAASSMRFDDSGRVQLLDRGDCALQSFRWHGWWSNYTRFRFGMGEQNGGLELVAAGSKGFAIAHKLREGLELVRTDDDLRHASRVRLAHPDGTPIDGRVRVDAAGRIWASDGWSISLCGDDGVARLTLGDGPELRKLGREPRVGIRRNDTLYAIAMRDGTLHEFDANGAPGPIAPLEHKQRVYGRELPSELVARLGANAFDEEPASDGRRAQVVPDWGNDECTIVIDGANGGELARWKLPSELVHTIRSLDLEGDVLALATPERIVVYHADGQPRLQMPIPPFDRTSGCFPDAHDWWRIHVARGGHELWLRRGERATTIERYALP